jgi:hypothetical protein
MQHDLSIPETAGFAMKQISWHFVFHVIFFREK